MSRPRKEETDEKALVQLTRDVTAQSPDISTLGMIIGTLSSDVKALEKLKKEAGSVEEFLALAGDLANVALVAAATKAAIGYDRDEVQVETKRFVDGYNTDGTVRIKDVPVGEKRTNRHVKPSETLLKFLLTNRLPQYFSDTKKVEINKKVIEIREDAEAEIKAFAGKLLDAVAIDAKFEDEDENTR